jgi:hypothetical protein
MFTDYEVVCRVCGSPHVPLRASGLRSVLTSSCFPDEHSSLQGTTSAPLYCCVLCAVRNQHANRGPPHSLGPTAQVLQRPSTIQRFRALSRGPRARILACHYPSAARQSVHQPLLGRRDRAPARGTAEVPTDRRRTSVAADASFVQDPNWDRSSWSM